METVKRDEDKLLVIGYLSGDESCLEKLYSKHYYRVYDKVFSVVRDAEMTEDLVQETFIKAFDVMRQGRYNEEGKFLAWILRVANNKAIDLFRRSKRYAMVNGEEAMTHLESGQEEAHDHELPSLKKDVESRLATMINDLPEEQRTVLRMRCYMGMSFKEISVETGVSINTALGRMRYALRNLRKQIGDKNKEDLLALVA